MAKKCLPIMDSFIKEWNKDRVKEYHHVPYMAIAKHPEFVKELEAFGYVYDNKNWFISDYAQDVYVYDYLENIWNEVLENIRFSLYEISIEEKGIFDRDCQIPNPLYNPKQKEFCCFASNTFEINEDYGKTKTSYDLYNIKWKKYTKGFEYFGYFFTSLFLD